MSEKQPTSKEKPERPSENLENSKSGILKAKDGGELETFAQHSVLNYELYECAVDVCENNDKCLLALSFCFLSKPQTSFLEP